MTVTALVLFGLSCIVGGCIQSIAGFGFSIFVMSVFPYFMPNYLMELVLNGFVAVPINAIIAWNSKGKPSLRMLLIPIAASLVSFRLTTDYLLPTLNDMMTLLLGLFLLLSSLFSLLFASKAQLNPNWLTGILAGLLYGVFSGLFSMGGPVMAIFLLAVFPDMASYYCNLNLFFFLTSIYTNIVRIANGMFDPDWIGYALLGCLCGIIGIWAGQKLKKVIPQNGIRRFIYLYVACSGVFIILRTLL